MNIYVLSAGVVRDYYEQSLPDAPGLPSEVKDWHKELDKNDIVYSLVAGKCDGKWYIEFNNLLLPEVFDLVHRRIRLSVTFGGLQSEAEVRALTLAYLAMEVQQDEDGDNIGRYCPELAAAYQEVEADYKYDFDAALSWAQRTIETYASQMDTEEPILPNDMLNESGDDETMPALDAVRHNLTQHQLTDANGKLLLFTDEQICFIAPYSAGTACQDAVCSSGGTTALREFWSHLKPSVKRTIVGVIIVGAAIVTYYKMK